MNAAVLVLLWAILSAMGVMLLHRMVPRQASTLEAQAPLEACMAAIAQLDRRGPLGHSGEEWVVGNLGHDLHGQPRFRLGLSHRITKRSLVVCKGTLYAQAGVSRVSYECGLDMLTLAGAPMILSAFAAACVDALQRAAAAGSWPVGWDAVPPGFVVLAGAFLLRDKLSVARSDAYALVAAVRGALASAQASSPNIRTGDPA